MPDEKPWHHVYVEVVQFMQVLWQADRLTSSDTDITDLTDYLANPTEWDEEYQAWETFGRPDLGSRAWDNFVDAITVDPETDEDNPQETEEVEMEDDDAEN